MKKTFALFFILSLLIPQAFASESNSLTITTNYKTTEISSGTSYVDDTLFVLLEEVCESFGSVVFKNVNNYYIITRSGDIVKHTLYADFYEINGNTGSLTVNSRTLSDKAYVPFEMISNIYYTGISFDSEGAKITTTLSSNFYTNIIEKLLSLSYLDEFNPESFTNYFTYYCYNPSLSAETVIKNINLGLNKVWHTDAVLADNPDSREVLVNKLNRLPENFTPQDLVPIHFMYTKNPSKKFYIDNETYCHFVPMFDAAAKEGLYLKIVSAYRTEDYQRGLYNSYIKSYGTSYAEKYSAKPGYSEHQTGLAVDINSVYTSFEKSKEYAWLKAHAHEYGFIERYKKGQEHITGYAYEPWHYRYVGVDAAKIIYQENITYEEYCAKYIFNSPYKLN